MQDIAKSLNSKPKTTVINLTKEQLDSVFPDWSVLFEQIEGFRASAEKIHTNNCIIDNNCRPISLICEDDILEHTKHSNVISVFGGRGSGKSSVLYTLRKKLIDNSKTTGDLVLPMVLPELVDNDNSLIGWVLSSLKPIVEAINNSHDVRTFSHGYFSDCPNKEHRLKQLYQDISKKCFNTEPSAHYSYSESQSVLRDKSSDRVEFYNNLNEFWQLLQEELVAYGNRCKDCTPTYPMIIIMFDDIDLSPEKCVELLMNSIKCFSNKNVIIIVSAAYKFLKPALMCRMFEKISGTKYRMLSSTAGIERDRLIDKGLLERTTIAFIDKVLPPYSRYFLNKFHNIDTRLTFRYSQPDHPPMQIDELLTDCVQQLTKKVLDNRQILKINNRPLYPLNSDALTFVENEKHEFIKLYAAMFGEKSRSVSSGCAAILNACDRLMEEIDKFSCKFTNINSASDKYDTLWDIYSSNVYDILVQTMTALLDSIPDVKQNAHDIAIRLLHHTYSNHCMYVNYAKLQDMYIEEMKHGDNLVDNEDIFSNPKELLDKKYLSIFMILSFIENLAALTIYKKSRIHVLKHFINFISNQLGYKDLFLYENYKEKEFFENYGDVIELIFNGTEIYKTNDALDIYLNSKGVLKSLGISDDQNNNVIYKNLESLCQVNYGYYQSLLKALFYRYSGIKALDLHLLPETNPIFTYLTSWSSIYANNISKATRIVQSNCVYMKENIGPSMSANQKNIIESIKEKCEKGLNDLSFSDEIHIPNIMSPIDPLIENKFVSLESIDNIIENEIADDLFKDKYQKTFLSNDLYQFACTFLNFNKTRSKKKLKNSTDEGTILLIHQLLLEAFTRKLSDIKVIYNGDLSDWIETIFAKYSVEIDNALKEMLSHSEQIHESKELLRIIDVFNFIDSMNNGIAYYQKEVETQSALSESYKKYSLEIDNALSDFLTSTKLYCCGSSHNDSLEDAIEFVLIMKAYSTISAYVCTVKSRKNSYNETDGIGSINIIGKQYRNFIQKIAAHSKDENHTMFTRNTLSYLKLLSKEHIDRQIVDINMSNLKG